MRGINMSNSLFGSGLKMYCQASQSEAIGSPENRRSPSDGGAMLL